MSVGRAQIDLIAKAHASLVSCLAHLVDLLRKTYVGVVAVVVNLYDGVDGAERRQRVAGALDREVAVRLGHGLRKYLVGAG